MLRAPLEASTDAQMPHAPSPADRRFRDDFEAGRISPAQFDHRAHVRLVYVYLAEHDDDATVALMREALSTFLDRFGVPPTMYHETMTQAWTLAVRHFMAHTPTCPSAAAFIESNPALLDPGILLTHYTAETLFSDEARAQFVEPDVEPIPRHAP